MRKMNLHSLPRAALLVALLGGAAVGAHAQSLDSLKGAASSAMGGGSSSSGMAGMAGMAGGMGGMSAGTMGNAAGVIEYCFKNNYLSGDGVSAVKDGLLGKMGGESKAKTDTGYMDGAKGMLTGGNGKSMDLSAGGLQKEATKKACEFVLDQGKSML
ncbi:DUF2501 domain-containing protein [Variovorax dokdonensis]|uniref:DUF2501 domain-containing protein n=1 Tax=Variovorax dokdonensis TaxID=344883 RepID=A0ABT7NB76_9BURK|nr:DUF2501 domain-containing protein [Variovorax dokdonensis]MDM0045168.1 DUF2501 domain-containing protein [Variovorax dokdonensis]